MLIAIGKIINKEDLIGLRVFDTDTKQNKDIKIEDANKIKIKNIKSIDKLGSIDNNQSEKPIIVIGVKDKKYLTVDINGDTKVLQSLEGYSYIDLLTNVEQYKKYQAKQSLIGNIFEFEIKEETDEVILTKYIENNLDFCVIEIPKFVTAIKIAYVEDDISGYRYTEGPFCGVKQNLKVVYKGNQLKSLRGMFWKYMGNKLDLSNFNTSNIENMCAMFKSCINLTEVNLDNFDTSKVKNMSNMFGDCARLINIDVTKFDTRNVEDMSEMFSSCRNLKSIDVSKLNTSNVKNMRAMFVECLNLKELDISNFDTSQVTDMSWMFDDCLNIQKINLSDFNTSNVNVIMGMFYGCKKLTKLDLSHFDISNVKSMQEIESIVYNTELTLESTGLKY